MGKKSRSDKQVYKRSNQKVYIKGQSSREKFLDLLARIIAMIFYPFYLLITGISKGIKSLKSMQWTEVFKGKSESKKPYYEKSKQQKTSPAFAEKFQSVLGTVKSKLSFDGLKGKGSFDSNKILALFNQHKVVISGALVLLIAVVAGAYALTNLEPTIDAAAMKAAEPHTVTVASEPTLEPLTDKPVIENLSFASVPTFELTVNNKSLGQFKTEEEAQAVLDDLVALYTNVEGSKILDWYFNEDVKVEKSFIDIAHFDGYDTTETVLAYIIKGTKEERTHVVQKGENYWVIAKYYGIDPSDLEAANPNVKPEAIQIGQEISLVVPKPLIDVCTVERAEYTDAIPYEVAYEDTSSLYKDETKVKVSGTNGEKAVTAQIVKENGRELGRIVLEETVLSEPTTKVVYKGTKDPPPKMGTGILKKPVSRGSVTSEFGYRWGSRHEGIDIGLPVGSEVRAADGGVVTFAGYSSSYGYYVMIDHGANIVTLYAHNSKLVVSKGQKVYQGQLISYSGNTGRSTGPHLHFEVRKNGTPVNPRNYVTF